MKQLLLDVLCLIWAINICGQENLMVGTWIGTYNGRNYDESSGTSGYVPKKLYIRINKYGDDYKIRMKEVDTKDQSNVWYFDGDYSVLNSDDTSIYFTYTDKMGKNYSNDKITSMDQRETHFLLTWHNGMIHISPVKKILIEYNSDGRLLSRTDISEFGYIINDLDLFKEENDW